MAQSINDIKAMLTRVYDPREAKMRHSLTLAYIGDAVYSDYVRRYLIAQGYDNADRLTKRSVHYVKASAQAAAIHALMPNLTSDEQAIVRRGRNTKSIPPKHASVIDYRYATGLEALFGYLDLVGATGRKLELMAEAIAATEQADPSLTEHN